MSRRRPRRSPQQARRSRADRPHTRGRTGYRSFRLGSRSLFAARWYEPVSTRTRSPCRRRTGLRRNRPRRSRSWRLRCCWQRRLLLAGSWVGPWRSSHRGGVDGEGEAGALIGRLQCRRVEGNVFGKVVELVEHGSGGFVVAAGYVEEYFSRATVSRIPQAESVPPKHFHPHDWGRSTALP